MSKTEKKLKWGNEKYMEKWNFQVPKRMINLDSTGSLVRICTVNLQFEKHQTSKSSFLLCFSVFQYFPVLRTFPKPSFLLTLPNEFEDET